MSQEEICEILKEKKKPLTVREIAEILGDNKEKIHHTIRRLLKHNEVKCIEIDRLEARKRFGISQDRKLRLYYL